MTRRYRPCEDYEHGNSTGKFCFKYCIDRKFFGDDCKEWKWDIRNFCQKDDFLKFRDGGFKMEVEK